MDAFQYLFTEPYVPFTVAILIMLGIGIVEALGLSLMALDIDLGFDGKDGHGGVLSWLGIGHVPLIMVLVAFLALFGVSGLIIQNVAAETLGTLPLLIAIPAALTSTLPLLGMTSRFLGRIMPKDETTAITLDELRGKRATIILGTAQPGNPTRATITDFHGQTHYLLVEPDNGTVTEGDELILVRREGDVFVGTSPFSTDFRSTI
jgi:hypothetical protein